MTDSQKQQIDTLTPAREQTILAPPPGWIWIEGDDEWPGRWGHEDRDELFGATALRPFDENPPHGDYVLRVPADKVASYAEVIAVAAEVVKLRCEFDVLLTRLHGAAALFDERSIRKSAWKDEA